MSILKRNALWASMLALIVLLTAFTPVPEVDLAVDTTVVEWPLDLYQSSYANRAITLNIKEGLTEKNAMILARRTFSGYDFVIEDSDNYQIRSSWVFRNGGTKRVRVVLNNNSMDKEVQFSFKFQSEEKTGADWNPVDEIPRTYSELLSDLRLKLTGF